MSHERLAQLMQVRREAMAADPETRVAYEIIVSIFSSLDKGRITEGQALRLLRYQAQRLADERAVAALYRQAAADLQQMQREEH